jgi:hypothetical protein
MEPQWARDIISNCLRKGVAPSHKQWGTYRNNPLVVEDATSFEQVKQIDPYGKGGGLIDGALVREFPEPRHCRAP